MQRKGWQADTDFDWLHFQLVVDKNLTEDTGSDPAVVVDSQNLPADKLPRDLQPDKDLVDSPLLGRTVKAFVASERTSIPTDLEKVLAVQSVEDYKVSNHLYSEVRVVVYYSPDTDCRTTRMEDPSDTDFVEPVLLDKVPARVVAVPDTSIATLDRVGTAYFGCLAATSNWRIPRV